MIEAENTLQQNQMRVRMSRAVICLARQKAIKETKREIQRQGRRKVSQIAHREIVAMANEYLAAHPELIAEAKERAMRWAAEGFFGKRASRSVQHSQVLHNARRS